MQLLRPLHEDQGFVNAFARHLDKHKNTVCSVCGLEVLGHGPESSWLGYEAHGYAPVSATPEQVQQARDLTSKAYRQRCLQELRGSYCISTH